MNKLDSITMRDLLPPNFKYDPDSIAASEAVSDDYRRICKISGYAVIFSNLEHLPEKWLDLLAADLHVDYYDKSLPLHAKQELVRQSSVMHRKKGTPWAVENLIKIVFGEGHLEEWFEYGGEPYHFRVYSTNKLATPEDARKFRDALESTKNLRSVLEGIFVLRTWFDVLEPYFWHEYQSDSWESVKEKDWFKTLGEHSWGDTLGIKNWSAYTNQLWGDISAQTWDDVLGERTWGQVYNHVWGGNLWTTQNI